MPETAGFFYRRLIEIQHEPGTKAVLEIQSVFEQLFRQLTAQESRLFSSLFQRIIYVSDCRKLPSTLQNELHGMRKFVSRATRDPDFFTSKEDIARCAGTLARVVFAASGENIPLELDEVISGIQPFGYNAVAGHAREKLVFVRITVTKVEEIRTSAKGTAFFVIEALEESSGRFLKIGFRDFESYAFTLYHPLLKPWRTLHLTNLESADKPDFFFTTLETLVVLEPDFLIDVTEIAECFSGSGREARLFLLSKFTHSEANEAALKGKIINDVMDALIETPDADPGMLIDSIMLENGLKAVSFGLDAIRRMHQEILQQFVPVLKQQIESMKGTRIRVEPSFFSPQFGLQGRLDVLEERENDPFFKRVFELKSGRAPTVYTTADGNVLKGGPRENVWPNHRMQVIAYHMLLRSSFGDSIRGKGAIFYPADAVYPLRDVEGAPQAERELLEVRNQMVYYLLELSEGRSSVLNELLPGRMFVLPTFKKTDAEQLETLIRRAEPDALAYVKAWAVFVARELHAAKMGAGTGDSERINNGFASLWLDEPAVKQARFNLLTGLTPVSWDETKPSITFDTTNCPPHNFREGDIVILQTAITGKSALNEQMLRGTLSALHEKSVEFTFRSRQPDFSRFKSGTWLIEHDLYESGYWGLLQGTFHFLTAPLRTQRLLLGKEAPGSGVSAWKPDAPRFPNQEQLVRNALAAPDYFLIQGPPGTGKTSTILVDILKALREETSENIVVLAYTNRAVSEIGQKLARAGIDFLSLSARDETTGQGLNRPGETLVQLDARIRTSRIFLSTVTSFQSRVSDILKLARPSILVVDEASQLVEPQLAGMLARFKKWILIGDQKQLPAVVQQHESATGITAESLQNIGFTDFRISLFERLYSRAVQMGWTHAYGMLENHFRMHADIANLINRHYGHKLVPGTGVQQTRLELPENGSPFSALLSRSRTLFIPSDPHNGGRVHLQEALRIKNWLRYFKYERFKSGDFFDEDGNARVGVITPFRAQISAIREVCGDALLEGVTVDTVERFQGAERDIILMSLAVNDRRQLAALQAIDASGSTDRKLLVAVSRARQHIILHGFPDALTQNPHYAELLELIRRQNGYIEPDETVFSEIDLG